MNLGEFIKNFSHNNVVRLVYKDSGGCHKTVCDSWDVVSMDWEILKKRGKFRHFIDNEVVGLATINVLDSQYPEALNIVIEEKEGVAIPFHQEPKL